MIAVPFRNYIEFVVVVFRTLQAIPNQKAVRKIWHLLGVQNELEPSTQNSDFSNIL